MVQGKIYAGDSYERPERNKHQNGCRGCGKKKSEHYYTEKPTSKLVRYEIKVRARGEEFSLSTASGLFSPSRLDKGSELLINSASLSSGWKVLDLGCGYGAVGITLKKHDNSVDVYFADINERALLTTTKNLGLLRLKGTVIKSDGLSGVEDYDFNTILLNPPQSAGKKLCFTMIEESLKHIVDGGLLQIVARHNKGGKELSKKMADVFGNVEETAKAAGYRIYVSRKKTDSQN